MARLKNLGYAKMLTNWAAKVPQRIPIHGRFVRAEPLDIKKHVDELYELHTWPGNWDLFRGHLLWRPPRSREEFEENLRKLVENDASETDLNYVCINRETGRIIAQRSYLQINPKHNTIELGRAFTFLKGPRSRINVEIQWLLINHAFELGYRRIHFVAVVRNNASNRALGDFGNQYEGVHRNMRMKQDEFYEHNKIVEENDMVVTSILSSEWPLLRRIVEEWMDDSNVDQNGQPIQQYEDIRNRVFSEANVAFRNTPEIYKTLNAIPERYRYYPLPRLPDKKILNGIYVKLEPLEQWHFDSLYQTLGSPNDVQNLSLTRPKKCQRDFGAWYMKDHDWASKYCYAIIDKNNNHVYGWMRFCDVIVDHGTLGIKAHLNKQYLQSPRIVEAIYMLCRYAFDILKYRRLEWAVNNNNVLAKDFVQRHGFLFESILRQYQIKDGENIDAAVFSITDVDWSKLRPVYEEWLVKVQFSGDGNDIFDVRDQEKYKL